MQSRRLCLLVAASLYAFTLVGCSDDDECPTCPPPAEEKDFVGSPTCGSCHQTEYQQWIGSGHAYKVVKVEGESPADLFPEYSHFPNDPIDPPQGLTWDDISYVVGGFGWKIRWIDSDGYMVSSGSGGLPAQYNFATQEYVTWQTGAEPGTRPYNCGQCHTTGWVANPDPTDLENNQDGLPGMHGTFFAGGIHCEECHGPGSLHAASPMNVGMIIDRSSAECGRCHTRDRLNRIVVNGDFIDHREQYDEWLHSPHAAANVGCSDCHNPHASVVFDAEAPGTGTYTSCTDCHDATAYAASSHSSALVSCTDCHMPMAARSATRDPNNPYIGDSHTHIMSISTAPLGRADGMFTEDGKFVRTTNGLAKISLDFACYSCHKDADGQGGSFSQRSLAQLAALAVVMHPNAKKNLLASE